MKSNIIEEYLFKKIKCENIKLDIEDCYLLDLEDNDRADRIDEFNKTYEEYQKFITIYDKAFNSLYEEEKYYVISRYYEEMSLKDMKPFYDENVCPFSEEDFKKYTWYLKRIILNKLEKKMEKYEDNQYKFNINE